MRRRIVEQVGTLSLTASCVRDCPLAAFEAAGYRVNPSGLGSVNVELLGGPRSSYSYVGGGAVLNEFVFEVPLAVPLAVRQ